MGTGKSSRSRPSALTPTSFKRYGYSDDGSQRYNIDKSRHLLHTPPALCWNAVALEAARNHGYNKLVAHFTDGDKWETTIETMDRHGFRIARDADPQVALPVIWWAKPPLPGTMKLPLENGLETNQAEG